MVDEKLKQLSCDDKFAVSAKTSVKDFNVQKTITTALEKLLKIRQKRKKRKKDNQRAFEFKQKDGAAIHDELFIFKPDQTIVEAVQQILRDEKNKKYFKDDTRDLIRWKI